MHSSLPGRADSARLTVAVLLAVLLHLALAQVPIAWRAPAVPPAAPIQISLLSPPAAPPAAAPGPAAPAPPAAPGIRRRNRAGSPNRAEQTGIQAGTAGATPSGSYDEGR
jgi:hypothetical protein